MTFQNRLSASQQQQVYREVCAERSRVRSARSLTGFIDSSTFAYTAQFPTKGRSVQFSSVIFGIYVPLHKTRQKQQRNEGTNDDDDAHVLNSRVWIGAGGPVPVAAHLRGRDSHADFAQESR